jgi:hypothetical protein
MSAAPPDGRADAMLSEALRTYPLRPLPRDLAPRVLARITPRSRFQLTWMDYALSGFGALMAAALLAGWRGLQSAFGAQLRTQALLLLQRTDFPAWAGALAGAAALAGLGLLLAVLLFVPDLRPTRRSTP